MCVYRHEMAAMQQNGIENAPQGGLGGGFYSYNAVNRGNYGKFQPVCTDLK